MEIAKVFLFVTEGTLQRKRYTLEGSARCVIGRATDCDIRLNPGQGAGVVSERHCVVDITQTTVRVRDLGSLTGTFVNGQKLQAPSVADTADADQANSSTWQTLEAGDVLRVGHALIRVAVCKMEQAADEPVYSHSVLWL